MRKLSATLLLLAASLVAAEEPQSGLAISLEPVGDSDAGVVARVTFKFVTPIDPLFEGEMALQGSFIQNGVVLRNFRYLIPAERPRQITAIQTFAEGAADVEVRLLQAIEEGEPPLLLVKTSG